MAKACACCQHSQSGELDAALLANSQTLKDLAVVYDVSAYSLSRHKARHLMVSPTDAPLSESEQLELWAARADEMYLTAGINSDVRSQCAALAAGLRALEFSFRRREEIQTQEVRALPEDLQKWSDAERSRMLEFLDDIVQNVQLPTPEEYALCYEGEMQQHEHYNLLPYRD